MTLTTVTTGAAGGSLPTSTPSASGPVGTAIRPAQADLSGLSLEEIKTLTGHY